MKGCTGPANKKKNKKVARKTKHELNKKQTPEHIKKKLKTQITNKNKQTKH